MFASTVLRCSLRRLHRLGYTACANTSSKDVIKTKQKRLARATTPPSRNEHAGALKTECGQAPFVQKGTKQNRRRQTRFGCGMDRLVHVTCGVRGTHKSGGMGRLDLPVTTSQSHNGGDNGDDSRATIQKMDRRADRRCAPQHKHRHRRAMAPPTTDDDDDRKRGIVAQVRWSAHRRKTRKNTSG